MTSNEIILTEEQAAPFRAMITKHLCCDRRHKPAFSEVKLTYEPIRAYPHSGGWKIPGLKGDPDEDGRYWLYISCPGCGYEWALWKLGVSRDFDPTKEPEH
jgi:hypothetical protein